MVGDEVGREDSEKRSVANCLRKLHVERFRKSFLAEDLGSPLAEEMERVMGIGVLVDVVSSGFAVDN